MTITDKEIENQLRRSLPYGDEGEYFAHLRLSDEHGIVVVRRTWTVSHEIRKEVEIVINEHGVVYVPAQTPTWPYKGWAMGSPLKTATRVEGEKWVCQPATQPWNQINLRP